MAEPAVSARVERVVDGDTVDVTARPWPGQTNTARVRILGIDTPEKRGKCDAEKAAAERVTIFVRDLIEGRDVELRGTLTLDSFGRVLARIALPDGRDLSDLLIQMDFARPYDGGARAGWCGDKELLD